jgi:hypothetical protein
MHPFPPEFSESISAVPAFTALLSIYYLPHTTAIKTDEFGVPFSIHKGTSHYVIQLTATFPRREHHSFFNIDGIIGVDAPSIS